MPEKIKGIRIDKDSRQARIIEAWQSDTDGAKTGTREMCIIRKGTFIDRIGGRKVIARMELENKIKELSDGTKIVYSEKAKKWYPIDKCDMAHIVDAVIWWNERGRNYGALSPEARKWMLESKNYYLEYYRINRAEGGMSLERYLAPKK